MFSLNKQNFLVSLNEAFHDPENIILTISIFPVVIGPPAPITYQSFTNETNGLKPIEVVKENRKIEEIEINIKGKHLKLSGITIPFLIYFNRPFLIFYQCFLVSVAYV
ncbi:hypothetical protein WQ54_29065 [Bacillus sp. SA1-12]|uniref:hypothetical protein n=1 Tax=Bacillus sp. SA1-12 TaxID=1455638 RepID=UPI00062717B2|nr:hypothetical protein [Bacillus sp. SA1-12]KKI88963.1 hypothetical protein WQ54_29065 [Bacillus sp. SA1-12]